MKKEAKAKHFIEKPVYPGGPSAMSRFIFQNMKYPKEALEAKIEGVVILRYDINYKGKVTEVKVLSSLGHGCDEEAIRLIKLLKFNVPKTPRKMKVLYHKTSRIKFKLPPAKNNTTYSYTTIKKPTKSVSEKSNEKQNSYHYSIRY